MNSHPDEMFIDGDWVTAGGGRLDIVDPATEQTMATALDADPDEAERAVTAARRAFDTGDWPRRSLKDQTEIFEAVLAQLDARAEEFALLQTAQMGVPITVSRAMINAGVNLFQAYVDGANSLQYEYLRRDAFGQSLVRNEPVGVVAAVTPWNGPLATVMNKVIPAMLTGCTVVLKPAPETPLDGGLFAELCSQAGLPPGVFNVVTGGRETGRALVASPGVDKVTFTGSTASGREVGEICGRQFKRMSLELGGKSAGIILPDADLDATVPQVVMGNFFNTGQACIAITRVLAPASLHDEIVDAMSVSASGLVVGDPSEETTELGPLVSSRQRDRVERYMAAGRDAGATVVLGGGRPDHLDRGWYVEPTIFTGVTNDLEIARDEIFGPVMSVIPYGTEAEAIAIANDSDYGLHGAVFTADPERGLAVARSIRSGSVSINTFGLTPATPYGGLKGSGVGREHGKEGVAAFVEPRSYVIPADFAATLEQDGVPVG